MKYIEAVEIGKRILEEKEFYSKRDVDKVILSSLFTPVEGKSLSMNEAKRVVKCFAISLDKEYSKYVGKAEESIL